MFFHLIHRFVQRPILSVPIAALLGISMQCSALAKEAQRAEFSPSALQWALVSQHIQNSLSPQPVLRQAQQTKILKALNHRPVEWFQLQPHSQIYVIDFDSYARQAETLNRVAALIELQNVPRDRVLSHEELRQLLAERGVPWDRVYVAHDYRLRDLARFFTLAGDSLNTAELGLRRDLMHLGLLQRQQQRWRAGRTPIAILSVAESSALETRRWALAHEIRHGRYFTEPSYRAACTDFWRSLSSGQRAAFTAMLAVHGYDSEQEDLMINETQAYLLANLSSLQQRGLMLKKTELRELQGRLLRKLSESGRP